jgi:hypothetical protein
MASLFPEGSFEGAPPSFDPICSARDPRKAAQVVKTLVVKSGEGRGVTDGMVEWSRLGWYEMAAFVVLHGRCCDGELALIDKRPFDACKLRRSLVDLHAAVRKRDAAAIEERVKGYEKVVRCVARLDLAEIFQQQGRPSTQEREVFDKTIARLR